MTQSLVAQLAVQMQYLSVDEMLALNKALVDMIKTKRRVQQAVVGSSFSIGQIVQFDGKRKGIKHIKIENFNRARTAVVGYEVDPKTGERTPFGVRWTVTNTLCTKVV
jgi:hypothetical protein